MSEILCVSFFRIPCQLHLWPTQISCGCFRRSLCSDGRLFYECSSGKNFRDESIDLKKNFKIITGIWFRESYLSVFTKHTSSIWPQEFSSLISKGINTKESSKLKNRKVKAPNLVSVTSLILQPFRCFWCMQNSTNSNTTKMELPLHYSAS